MTGEPEEWDFTAYYIQGECVLAAAGTQHEPIARFMEGLRIGQPVRAQDLRQAGPVNQ